MTFKNLQNMGIIVPTNFGLDKRLSSFKNEFYILEHIVQDKIYPKIQISLVSRTPKKYSEVLNKQVWWPCSLK